ncbi:hypothetical protein Ae706Ps2_6728 [Pseudonocardia sp. Ae706_Ps2]|nr:hypothetical protein Ae706Ps2_6728 [Pseudonocardia sp. Ae706_Ps2]
MAMSSMTGCRSGMPLAARIVSRTCWSRSSGSEPDTWVPSCQLRPEALPRAKRNAQADRANRASVCRPRRAGSRCA